MKGQSWVVSLVSCVRVAWLTAIVLLLTTHDSRLTTAFADVIYFASGEELKGLVVEEHRDRVVMSTAEGEQMVLRSRIDEIFYDDPERNYLYLGNQSLENGDFSTAQGLFRKSMQMNPEFQEADDALNRLVDLKAKRADPTLEAPDLSDQLFKRWGLRVRLTEGWPRVQSVEPNSQAQRAGLLAGDTLIGLWGESLAFLPEREVAYLLLGPSGSMAKVTLERAVRLPPFQANGPAWPGFKLSTERLGLTVVSVQPRAAAAQAGFLAWDRIVAIDGKPTRYMPLKEAQRLVQASRERGLMLTLHRDLRMVRE